MSKQKYLLEMQGYICKLSFEGWFKLVVCGYKNCIRLHLCFVSNEDDGGVVSTGCGVVLELKCSGFSQYLLGLWQLETS